MTSLQTCEGGLYLAAEMDLCSRRILGRSTRKDLATELPNAALALALQARGSAQVDLRHPSDGGRQNNSGESRKRLELRGITPSRSRKANCYDNAAMESFRPPQGRVLWRKPPRHSRPISFHGLRLN